MNKRIALWALLVLFASVTVLLRSDKKPPPRLVNYEGFDELTLSKKADLIRVSDREARFLEIPWIFDIFEGFRLAKKENRPVFLYTVGGNPLADCWTYARKFREDVLTDPDVIDRVSTTMIPVAFDYYKIVDSSTKESKFLAPKMETRNQYQGVWIFSPDAEVLGGYESSVPLHRFEETIDHGRASDCLKKTQMEINRVMSSFGQLAPRPAPKRPAVKRFHPPRSDGSIDLPLYVRRRGASNVNSPIICQTTLTANDLACFLPTTTELTTEIQSWVVPNRVTKKFYRALSPLGSESAPTPEWIRDSELKAKFDKASTMKGSIDVRLEGFIVSAEQGYSPNSVHSEQKLNLDGLCRFDQESKQLVSIQIVGTGSICWIHEAPDKSVKFDALIEWFAEQN